MPFRQLRAVLRRESRRAGLAQRGHASSAKLEPGQHSPERHSTGDVGTAPGHRATPSRPPATPRAGKEEEREEEETPGGAASRHGRGPRARRRAPPAAPPPPGAAAPEAAAASSVPGVSLPLPPSRGGSGQRRTPGRPRPPGPPAPAYLGAAHRLAAARQLHPDPGGGRRPARRREGGPPVLLRPQHGQPHLEQALDAAPAPLQQAAFLRRDGELVRPRPRPGAAGRPAASRHQRRPRRAALRPRIPPGRGTTTRGIPGRAHGAASSPRAGRSNGGGTAPPGAGHRPGSRPAAILWRAVAAAALLARLRDAPPLAARWGGSARSCAGRGARHRPLSSAPRFWPPQSAPKLPLRALSSSRSPPHRAGPEGGAPPAPLPGTTLPFVHVYSPEALC